jgi:hypothetical protein
MKEKKSIDRIFQEKFKDFEAEPREKVWDNITSKLDAKKKKRPLVIPLWFKIGGVAALLASLIFTQDRNGVETEPGVVFEDPEDLDTIENSTENNSGNTINIAEEEDTSTDEDQEYQGRKTDIAVQDDPSENSRITSSNAQKEKSIIKENKRENIKNDNSAIASIEEEEVAKKKNEKEEEVMKPEVSIDNTSGIIANMEEIEKDSAPTKTFLKKEENALAQVEKTKNNEKDEEELSNINSRKVRISTFAAPVFYKNIGGGNELSSQFANNPSSSEVTFSYGIKLAYEISDKIRVRTGVSKINISNNIGDISYSPAALASSFENIRSNTENIQIRDNAGPNSSFASESNRNALTSSIFTPGEINQQFGFIEIPLEIEYALINKRFGLNLIGGGSSLFLDQNRVDLVSGNSNTRLGEAANINNTSFSTNIGLGMDYKLNDRFSFSLEPIFKYQLNTFNNVDNVQPVNFGIYSGINLKF